VSTSAAIKISPTHLEGSRTTAGTKAPHPTIWLGRVAIVGSCCRIQTYGALVLWYTWCCPSNVSPWQADTYELPKVFSHTRIVHTKLRLPSELASPRALWSTIWRPGWFGPLQPYHVIPCGRRGWEIALIHKHSHPSLPSTNFRVTVILHGFVMHFSWFQIEVMNC
jgi:hypothetical protein